MVETNPVDILFSAITSGIVFLLGSAIGSFLNVVIYRIPANLSILYPPSRCPKCLHKLAKRDNVPVFGWLWLKGRCRYCQTPISPRYPLVEAITGLLFLLVFWVFGYSVQTIGYWLFISWLLALALIDLDTMLLPGVLTKSGLGAGLLFQLAVGSGSSGTLSDMIRQLMVGIIGAVVGIWVFDLIRLLGALLLQKPAMGDGDPHLTAMMGAWLGWKLVLLAGFVACGLGAVIGGGAIAMGWRSRNQPIPFGPFLALGAIAVLFAGEAMIQAYLSLFFPISGS